MARRGRKIFDKAGNTYFVTTTVVEFIKIFSLGDHYYDILIDSLKYLIKEHKASLFGYVLMPNHIHLVLHLPEGESLSDFMRDFKRHTSVRTKEILEKDGQISTLDKLTVNGKYKLWMDRFDDLIITSDKTLEIKMNYIHFNPVRAGYVTEISQWKYSSARNYDLDDNTIIDIFKG